MQHNETHAKWPALQYVTAQQLAGRTGILPVHVSTIYRWIARGAFPQPVAIGGRKLWNLADVKAFLESRSAK